MITQHRVFQAKPGMAGEVVSTDEDYNLWVQLHQVRDIIFRARENELSQHGFTSRKAMMLFIIEAIGGTATAAEISKWAMRAPHSIASILDRMEKDGLIRKKIDLDYRNRRNISLTEKGQQAYRQSLNRESIGGIMSCLTERERQQLSKLLEKLRTSGLETLSKKRMPTFT